MENPKKCSRCKLVRPISEFTKNRRSKDGFAYECRSCKAEAQNIYQSSDKGRRASQKAVKTYQATEKGKKAFRDATQRYCVSKHGKQKRSEYYNDSDIKERERLRSKEYWKKLKKFHPEKYQAYLDVKYALASGKIKRPDKCEKCPSTSRIEAHHEDYSKPLEVEWLCVRCHRGRDGEHGKSKDGPVPASSPEMPPGQEKPC